MPARMVSFSDYTPREAQYSLLLCQTPGHPVATVGVLLLDPGSDTLHVRLRRDWESVAGEEDAEVLAELEDDLRVQSQDLGGMAVLERLEDIASESVRISERHPITVRDFDRKLGELYRQHVPAEVLAYRTHLPRYSMAVAAGPFLTNPQDIEVEEWIETPADLRIEEGMFVARIQGRSMEPRILDGSLCVFRREVVGSRNGRLVLVRNSELADENQYTVKRYTSEKAKTKESFRHVRIRLESLNPDFPSWDLDQDDEKYQVIAEFVRVL